MRSHFHDHLGYFSGRSLTVAPSVGLNDECNVLLPTHADQTVIQAPLLVVVEAKDADLTKALGQCAAQIVGAQRFNQRKGQPPVMHGSETHACNLAS